MYNKKFSKIFIFLLPIIIFYNTAGFIVVFIPAQVIIKHFVLKTIEEKKIPSDDLSILSFKLYDLANNKYDFNWKKPGKEFRFNGKMYDIEEKELKGDSIHYTVYYDHKENLLEELFSAHFFNQEKDKSPNNISRIFLLGVFNEEIDNTYPNGIDEPTNKVPSNKNDQGLVSYLQDIPTPPPR